MKKSIKFKPGSVQGSYPERTTPKSSLADDILDKMIRFFQQPAYFSAQSLFAVTQSVRVFEDELRVLDDIALRQRIETMRSALHLQGLTDPLIHETFALVREVANRTLNLSHFDVQLMGGWVMIKGHIAQMQTGEGKTLVATLPACTAALAGIPVHIVTVNDYLVQRDTELMSPIYEAFGLSVGQITENMDLSQRQAAYACDITYCSNKQLTFDYLKDKQILGQNKSVLTQKLKFQLDKLHVTEQSLEHKLHLRGLCFAIVDEADSVFIDESRTPLILSRERDSKDLQHLYSKACDIARQFQESEDYVIDHKNRLVELTLSGVQRLGQESKYLSGIWSAKKYSRELITKALTALHLFIRDVHYIVSEEKVVIVDEFTGRVMADRSWEAGLHQLIETKEGCDISGQNETLAKISYQTFFRRYLHLSGMTGTASEVAKELFSVYKLQVVDIPTNLPAQRLHYVDQFFSSQQEKWQALLHRIQAIHEQNRPVLIGTCSVEASETLAQLLTNAGLDYALLNARQDADEADIVQNAGCPGTITIATNMAGRGTDIHISEQVNILGGLHVIATECHESKRIDRQLFGRCARQGDKGSYEMYLSLEDSIVTKYSSSPSLRFGQLLLKHQLPGARMVVRGLFYWSQQKAEKHHAAIRSSLFKMDSRLNDLLAFSGKPE